MPSLQRSDRPAAARQLPRAAACALLWLVVPLVHWALLDALAAAPAAPAQARTARAAVSLRLLPSRPPEPVPAPVSVSVSVSALQTAAAPMTAPRPVPRPRPAAAAAPAALPMPAPAGEPIPVYATQLPEPARLSYRLQRGERIGSASLHWQVDDAGYLLRLDTDWPGQPAQGTASRGLIDADGVAPVRHAELRRAREVRAVNFRREAGLISFSGPQAVYALRAGAQDRLSWMIQLPAIVQADARLARPGAIVTLFVAGTRGDAEAWRFEVLGRETLQLPAGEVADALRLRREPTRPYDTRVEVWLDPARRHLPVRARFTTLPGGTPLELTLQAVGDAAYLEKTPGAPR
ncbi:MAG TPA: DUF3108 domain-containing protein [Rubrivivax sp.]|nr:DUF3108 domain-containing protein [Rubrivivax sp.]